MPLDLGRVKPVQERSKYLKAILYGLPGVGKTTLAASGPECIVIDCEKGTKSLLLDPRFDSVRIFEPEEFKDVDDLFWALREGKLSCQTLVLDSITEFQRIHLDELLTGEHARNPAKSQYLAEQQHYRLSTEMMRRHVLALRELPLHFVVTAHATETTDELGKLHVRPAVTPKLSSTLIGMMDLIGYLEVDVKGERNLVTKPMRRISAKNRIGIPAEIQSPQWENLTGILSASQ